jgi:uncharacterized protein (TIGR00369 family)
MLSEEIVSRIRERIIRGPFGIHMDFTVEEIAPDTCVLRLPSREEITNAGGIVHGGATSALVDTAAVAAAWATDRAAPKARGATVGFTINYLAPGRDSDLIAQANVVHRGGSLTVVDVIVRDERGAKIAKAQVTYKIKLIRPTR